MSHVNESAESIKSIESAAESILEKETEMLLSEQPKIDVSIKNFIAYFMGQQATSPGDCKGSLPEVVKICQTLLKHIQSIELPPTSIWGEQFPQGDSQSSFDRMNQITRYKVIHMIRKRTIDNGNKISKIFGFSYIKDTGIWSKLKSICLDALQSNELAIEVLDLFESSFPNYKSSDDEPTEITQFVWSHDFNQVLKERREKRLLEIEERKKQEDEEDVAGKECSVEFLENEDHTT